MHGEFCPYIWAITTPRRFNLNWCAWVGGFVGWEGLLLRFSDWQVRLDEWLPNRCDKRSAKTFHSVTAGRIPVRDHWFWFESRFYKNQRWQSDLELQRRNHELNHSRDWHFLSELRRHRHSFTTKERYSTKMRQETKAYIFTDGWLGKRPRPNHWVCLYQQLGGSYPYFRYRGRLR